MAINTRTASDAIGFVRANETGQSVVRSHLAGALAASLTLSDIILIAKIPTGATITNFWMAGLAPSDATTFKVGVGGAGSTGGTGADDDAIISTVVTLSATAAIQRFNAAATMPYKVSLSDDANPRWTYVFATLVAGTSTNTCSIQFVVEYAMPGAI